MFTLNIPVARAADEGNEGSWVSEMGQIDRRRHGRQTVEILKPADY